MSSKKKQESLSVIEFTSSNEIERAIARLERRLKDVRELDVATSFGAEDGKIAILKSDVQDAICEVFGEGSPEYQRHKFIDFWSGPLRIGMPHEERLAAKLKGQTVVANVLSGLIARLQEKRQELDLENPSKPAAYFGKLNLHPRIRDVSEELFVDGHHWEAVFAAGKALINFVRERAGVELDGVKLMYVVFSKNNPVLAFNELSDTTGRDEQEGMMHLFVGAVLAMRNPGGHAFPEGSEQRACEYISFLSTLAYRVQEAKWRKPA